MRLLLATHYALEVSWILRIRLLVWHKISSAKRRFFGVGGVMGEIPVQKRHSDAAYYSPHTMHSNVCGGLVLFQSQYVKTRKEGSRNPLFSCFNQPPAIRN